MTPQNNAILQCLLYHFKANCTEFDFCLGCTPDSARELTLPPPPEIDPSTVFKGPVSKGVEEKGEKIAKEGDERREGGAREKCEAEGPHGSYYAPDVRSTKRGRDYM